MKKRLIYLLMAAIGTVGFTGCGPGQNTTQDRTGTNGTTTGTEMGTTQDRTGTNVGTTGTQTGTTGTSGTRTTTGTQGTTGNQTGTTGTSGTRTTTGTQGTTGNQTGTTGTSGTSTTTTTGTEGTTTNNTGQRTGNVSGDTNMNTTGQTRNNFRLNQATDYSYNNENFRFSPDQKGISITRDQNGTQSPFGNMRSFGNDGYYMVTTTNASGEEEFSVGRFDERGNFTVYRYDKDGDRVTEQNYRSSTPGNQNNR